VFESNAAAADLKLIGTVCFKNARAYLEDQQSATTEPLFAVY
jgi:hypothetical protein